MRTFVALVALVALAPSLAASEPPRNVLIVLADDVGVDAVDCYAEGQDRPSTPVIDALAAEGLLFRNAWAHSSCSPARAALMTGRDAFRTGVGAPLTGTGHALQPSEVTLPELLDLHPTLGYANAFFGKWHLGNASVGGLDSPNVAGWDHYAGWIWNLKPPESYYDWPLVVNGSLSTSQEYLTSKTVDLALEWLGAAEEPWLCTVAFHAAHYPYHAPPDHLHTVDLPDVDPREDPRPFFRAIVEAMDTELGRLLDGLGDQRERTTVIFASDNGTTKEVVLPPFTPEHAKLTPYEGGVNVPLVVHGPVVAAPGRESDHLVRLADLFATVAELAGMNAEAALPGVELDSKSFLPVVLNPAATPARRACYSEQFAPNGFDPAIATRIARDGRFKLILQDTPVVKAEFYDLWSDPFELIDLLQLPSLEPDAAQALAWLRGYIDQVLD